MEIQVTLNGIRVPWIEKAVMNYAMAMLRIFVNKMDRKGEKSKRSSKLPKPGSSDETR